MDFSRVNNKRKRFSPSLTLHRMKLKIVHRLKGIEHTEMKIYPNEFVAYELVNEINFLKFVFDNTAAYN